jgi:hypothetical protein
VPKTAKTDVNSASDHRSTLAIVRDEWLESEEGKRSCEGTAEGQYLRNRIELAFLAGARSITDEKSKAAINICDTISWQVSMGRQILVAESILVTHAEKWDEVKNG